MRQVVVIHGGDSFASYDDFFANLMQKILHLDRLKFRDWKDLLQEQLGSDYEVLQPRMPNPQNAKYKEWKVWFEKLIPQLEDGVVLVGHSLGAAFLAKYLGEEAFPKKIVATMLVAAPYKGDGERALVEFVPPDSLSRFEQQGGQIFLYHSKDDSVVGFSELSLYETQLPSARVTAFSDRQHFNQDSFPEIVKDLKELSS